MRTDVHPDEAISLILEAGGKIRADRLAMGDCLFEDLPLAFALGRILVDSVKSPVDHPPFDKSAMDGFAVCAGEAGTVVKVVAELPAGSPEGESSGGQPGPGEAARIMTGAPVPLGAGLVQRIEWTETLAPDADGSDRVRFTRTETADNIIRRGENLRAGEILLGARRLLPQDIGILASGGLENVRVSIRPRVAVLSTGNEIAGQGRLLPSGCIYDSNGPQLVAQSLAAGADTRFFGVARDEAGALRRSLSDAFAFGDVVLVSGGVSLGDFDLVPSTLRSLGVETVFHSLKMRPGKPTFFGLLGGKAVFGLPGNPVSTFVNFEVLVKPYLYALQGLELKPATLRLPLAAPLSRRGSDRVEYLPVSITSGPGGSGAMPLRYHGSSMLNILAVTDGLVRMELGESEREAGEMIDVRLLRP